MKILKASFGNYKGLRKISTNGEFVITLPDNTNIHSVSGENGMGKSTLVSNLNPFIFPNGHNGKSTSDFVDFPAHKNIDFVVGGVKYRSEITFNNKSSTKARLLSVVGGEWEIVSGYESGKITTYIDLLEKFFGATQKNITLVNYIGQNTNAIIESNAKTRRELISPLIGSLDEHNVVISKYETMEKDIKVQITEKKGVCAGIKSKLGEEDIGSLPDVADIKNIKTKISMCNEQIEQNTNRGKKYRLESEKILSLVSDMEKNNVLLGDIKAEDNFDSFPDEIKYEKSEGNLEDLKNQRKKIVEKNTESEQARLKAERSLVSLKNNYETAKRFNDGLLKEYSEEDIMAFSEIGNKVELMNKKLYLDKEKLSRLTNEQVKFKKNKEIYEEINRLSSLVGCEGIDDKSIKKELEETNIKIFDISRDIDGRVKTFVETLIKEIDDFKYAKIIKKVYENVFGQPVNLNSDLRAERLSELNRVKKELEDSIEKISNNINNTNNINRLEKNINKNLVDNTDEIEKISVSIEKIISSIGELNSQKKLVSYKDEYIKNKNIILNFDSDEKIQKQNILLYRPEKIDLIDVLIEKAEKSEQIIKANSRRSKYRKILGENAKIQDMASSYKDISEIKNILKECENRHVELRNNVVNYNSELVKCNVGYQKKKDYLETQQMLGKAEEELDALIIKNKVNNAIKLYTKNIKETIMSLYMVNITNLANQYLAMDENSSINIALSIEQKGQNFNINAKQDEGGVQDVNTLSGAEKSTVNRALATAIAFSKENNVYGNYCFDEADSALSQSNKRAFAKNIKDIASHEMVEQLFIISHDDGITDYLDANKITLGVIK